MMSAFFPVMWGIVFIAVILLVWSLLAVQILHPINLEVEAQGIYADCTRCPHAFASVWNAFLTFAQTLVFGDSWGAVALPIIEEKWWTIIIFFLAFATIGLAAMNLILAAIVDSGAQAREAALEARNEKVREKEEEDKKRKAAHLLVLCQELDTDESGKLSREELLSGFDKNTDFREAVTTMKFCREDIEVLFAILDKDLSGDVDYTEFLDVMEHAQGEDMQQMMVFMKFAIMDLWMKRQQQDSDVAEKIDGLRKLIDSKAFSCQDSCASEGPTPISAVPQKGVSSPRPQQPQQSRARTPIPKRKAASPEPPLRGTRRAREASSRPPDPLLSVKEPNASSPPEPKDTGSGEVACKLVGDWNTLEAAAMPISDVADSLVDSRSHQELVRILKKIVYHTEAHTRSLESLDKAIGGHVPTWRRMGAWNDGLRTEAVALQVDSVLDPTPLPPSEHGLPPGQNCRVGL
uniref:EF-hand domain-containing protein n=1 Tax=Alexandrium catenella TaxID=2925 RepID=A0A7S1QGB9_ALECA